MKTASQRYLGRGLSLLLLLLAAAAACWQAPSCEALMIGRRRIQCTTPVGGKDDSDALMDARPNLPYCLGFVGFQAFLPTLGQCPPSVAFQPPWFNGNEYAGGGLCPPEYYNLVASAPGLAIIGAAAVWALYIESNRLLVTDEGLGTLSNGSEKCDFEETVLFSEIEDWFMTPVGLVVRSSETKFFPMSWDAKSLEAVLEERIPK
jgi:hypothetical protein